jgi:hypothetical protein
MPNLASPAVFMMSGTTAVAGTWGVQLMSHYPEAKKKFNLISELFLDVSNRGRGEWGTFLKLGGKCPDGWV